MRHDVRVRLAAGGRMTVTIAEARVPLSGAERKRRLREKRRARGDCRDCGRRRLSYAHRCDDCQHAEMQNRQRRTKLAQEKRRRSPKR